MIGLKSSAPYIYTPALMSIISRHSVVITVVRDKFDTKKISLLV